MIMSREKRALKILLPALTVFSLLPALAHGGTLHPEQAYQEAWCAKVGGVIPKKALSDGTFPDCLTDEYAVEVDFAPKWAEAVGQSMNYAAETGKRPGILLIIEKPSQVVHYERLKEKFYWIKVWVIRPEDLTKYKNNP